MKIKTTTKVQAEETPTDAYRIYAEFDNEYGGGHEIEVISKKEDYVIAAYKLYKSYEDGLAENWNKYCNGESVVMNELAKEARLEVDSLCELWQENEGGYNMLESFSITYYDENGIEWETEIK